MKVKATIDFEIDPECDSMSEWLPLLADFFDNHMAIVHEIKVEQHDEG